MLIIIIHITINIIITIIILIIMIIVIMIIIMITIVMQQTNNHNSKRHPLARARSAQQLETTFSAPLEPS